MTFEAWALFCLTVSRLPEPRTVHLNGLAGHDAGARRRAATTGVLAANAMLRLSRPDSRRARTIAAAVRRDPLARRGVRDLDGRAQSRARSRPAEGEAPGPARRALQASSRRRGQMLVYFTAILPQFVDARAPLASQLAVLAASSFAIEFAVLSAYSGISHRAGKRAAPGFRRWIPRVGGTLLIAAGAGLAAMRRGPA
jgi:hypothetical protein